MAAHGPTAVALVAGLLLAAPPLAAQSIVPRERLLHRTTEAGRELRIGGYTRMEPGCVPGEPPRIVMLHPPSHGAVDTRPGSSRITEVRQGTAAACAGMTAPGNDVFYTPAPGYRGADQFDYNVISRGGIFHDSVTVEVR